MIRFLAEHSSIKVLAYSSFRGEPDLTSAWSALMQAKLAKPLKLYLPKVEAENGRMHFVAWLPGEPLIPNRYGILEAAPTAAAETLSSEEDDAQTAILVPGLAFDQSGFRLGYGGGYYDRFLAQRPRLIKVGIAFESAFVQKLPSDQHDVAMDFVLTEKELHRAAAP